MPIEWQFIINQVEWARDHTELESEYKVFGHKVEIYKELNQEKIVITIEEN